MDVLSDVLRSVRLTAAVFFDMEAHSPWVGTTPRSEVISGLVMPDAEHVICFHVLTVGTCWVELADRSLPPVALSAGDVASSSARARLALSLLDPRNARRGRSCRLPAPSRPPPADTSHSQRNDRWPRDVPFRLRLSRMRFAPLQSAARCAAAPVPRPCVRREPRMAGEPPSHSCRRDRGRQGRPRDHAGETGRAFVHRHPSQACRRTGGRPARMVLRIAGSARRGGASADPCQAVRDWTLEALAHEAGLSRSLFAKRFNDLVGTPRDRVSRALASAVGREASGPGGEDRRDGQQRRLQIRSDF